MTDPRPSEVQALADLWLEDIVRCGEAALAKWQEAHRNEETGALTFVGPDGPFYEGIRSVVDRMRDYHYERTRGVRVAPSPDAPGPHAQPRPEATLIVKAIDALEQDSDQYGALSFLKAALRATTPDEDDLGLCVACGTTVFECGGSLSETYCCGECRHPVATLVFDAGIEFQRAASGDAPREGLREALERIFDHDGHVEMCARIRYPGGPFEPPDPCTCGGDEVRAALASESHPTKEPTDG